DHLDLRSYRLNRERNAADQPAPADGHEDFIHVVQLVQDFQTYGALTADHVVIIEGMNEGIAVLFGKLQSLVVGLIVDVAVDYHLRPVLPGGVDLQNRSYIRHYDGGFYAALLRGESYPLCVVS